MNNTCVITVMESDDEKFVVSLANSLTEKFDSVRLLALGSEQEVNLLKGLDGDVFSADELDYSYEAEHLFVLSMAAVLELGSVLTKFEKTTLWFDPTLSVNSVSQDLIGSVIGNGLISSSTIGICARSDKGAKEWKRLFDISTPLLPSLFRSEFDVESVEPLIEKKDSLRILIDGSSNITNFSMVEPFIALQSETIKSDIWCHYAGELKSWMKPDYQIGVIPKAELPLYTAAVDAVVVVGESIDSELMCDYMNLGLMPIAISESALKQLDQYIDIDEVRKQFPAIGTVLLLNELIASKEAMDQYNSLSSKLLRENIYFNSDTADQYIVDTAVYSDFVHSKAFQFSREEYLKLSYGDSQGSSFHKKIKMNSQIIAEFSPTVVQHGVVTGWSVNTSNSSLCEPFVLYSGIERGMLFHRYRRADVAEYFRLNPESDIGFSAQFTVNESALLVDNIMYGVKVSEDTCSTINTMLEDLDVRYSSEVWAKHGYNSVEEGDHKGCIETLTYTEALRFPIVGVVGDVSKCDFRMKSGDRFVSADSIEMFAEVDGQLQKVELNSLDDYSFSITTPSLNTELVSLYVKMDRDSLRDLICVVSTDDLNVTCQEPIAVESDSGMDSDRVNSTQDQSEDEDILNDIEKVA